MNFVLTQALAPDRSIAPRSPHKTGQVASKPTPLGENLVLAGLLSDGDLEAALRQHSSSNSQLGETLLEMGFVEEDTLLLFLGQQLGVPSVRLRSGIVDPSVCVSSRAPKRKLSRCLHCSKYEVD